MRQRRTDWEKDGSPRQGVEPQMNTDRHRAERVSVFVCANLWLPSCPAVQIRRVVPSRQSFFLCAFRNGPWALKPISFAELSGQSVNPNGIAIRGHPLGQL